MGRYDALLDCWKLDAPTRSSASDVLAILQRERSKVSQDGDELVWPESATGACRRGVALTDCVLDLNSPAAIAAFDLLEVPPDAIVYARLLGEGEFGEVRLGQLTLPPQFVQSHPVLGCAAKTPLAMNSATNSISVAVKTLKPGTSSDLEAKFLLEARILAALQHDHIVSLLAVCFQSCPHTMVVELLAGDMLVYLHEHGSHLRSLALEECQVQLLGACAQIADAMALLERQRIVHRDLAARFALISVIVWMFGILDFKLADFLSF